MTERDFCYWLQGYFELTLPDAINLTGPRIDCIRRHIDLVRVTEPGKPSALCAWIDGALAGGGSTAEAAVRERLAQHFKHVIDPQHPEPGKASAAHSGGGHHGDVILRC